MLLFAFLAEELRMAYSDEKEPVQQERLKTQARKGINKEISLRKQERMISKT